MRTFLLILGICMFAQFSQGQLFLNAGDSYAADFAFSSGTIITGLSPRCIQSFPYADRETWSTDASVRLELFENSVSEPPIFAGIYTSAPVYYLRCYGSEWEDHQGAVRFSVLSGSLRLDKIGMQLDVPIGERQYMHYLTWIFPEPVPEPSTLALISCAAVLFAWRISSKHKKTGIRK